MLEYYDLDISNIITWMLKYHDFGLLIVWFAYWDLVFLVYMAYPSLY
jgi:hypothetical protein